MTRVQPFTILEENKEGTMLSSFFIVKVLTKYLLVDIMVKNKNQEMMYCA